jgi:hypothetical protein
MNTRNLRPVPGSPQFKPPDINIRSAAGALLVLIVLLAIWSSVFTVEPEEVGVVLTFGSRPPRPSRRSSRCRFSDS